MDEDDAPPEVTFRDLFGPDADEEEEEEEQPRKGKKKHKRVTSLKFSHARALDDEAESDDDDDDDGGRPAKRQRKDGDDEPETVEGTCFGMQRKLVESLLTFKMPPDLKRRLETDRVEIQKANRGFFAESKRIFLNEVIQGVCPPVSSHGSPCERCTNSASYWISGEVLDPKVIRSNVKGIIYEAFRVFYNEAEKLPDMTGINWHNFLISDVLRFSDIQFRPTFYLAADIVELLCSEPSFVAHIKQPRLARRLADFLLFALQFHATENSLRQIANRLVPEITRLGLIVPSSIQPLRDAIRSPARSIRRKRVLRHLKQLVHFVLTADHGFGSRSDRCILLTRLFLVGLRRPG